MLQGLFPLSSTLNILRTLNDSYTITPNATGFGPSGSVYAQLFYDGEEQFYCTATSCDQTLGIAGDNSTINDGKSDWLCQDLKCHCFTNATFCGAVPEKNLTATMDNLVGTLEISCDAVSPENNTATCAFKQATILDVFGSNGLTLDGCQFGECVRQYVIDNFEAGPENTTSTHVRLQPGVTAGLSIVGGIVGVLLLLLLFGWFSQRWARRGSRTAVRDEKGFGGVGLQWSNINYIVPNEGTSMGFVVPSFLKRGSRYGGYKVVLDGVSGVVQPGQMMAVLGPSGACVCSRSLRLYHSRKS